MTLLQVYQDAFMKARPKAQDSCAFDLSCLFEHVFGVSRYSPKAERKTADPLLTGRFQALCERYIRGEPLQYLLGEWEFWGLPFYVGEGVLIPRPDTETLVECVLALLKGRVNPVVADLCAGSGCISVAIAHERPDASIYALEKSAEAFSYLCRNISRNGVTVCPVAWDVLSRPEGFPLFDLVVSNPPYLTTLEMQELQPQVACEPALALDGGEDGLAFYRAIPPLYAPLLKPRGALAFEVGYRQAHQVAEIMEQCGYKNIQIQKDLCGVERVVVGFL